MAAAMNKGLDIPLWVAPVSRARQNEKVDLTLPFWVKPVCDGSIGDYTSVVPQYQTNLPKHLLKQRELANARRLFDAIDDDCRSEASTSPDDFSNESSDAEDSSEDECSHVASASEARRLPVETLQVENRMDAIVAALRATRLQMEARRVAFFGSDASLAHEGTSIVQFLNTEDVSCTGEGMNLITDTSTLCDEV
jgi:hypothetical protein